MCLHKTYDCWMDRLKKNVYGFAQRLLAFALLALESCPAGCLPIAPTTSKRSPLPPPSIPPPGRIKQPAMGSASACVATATAHLVVAAALLLMLARGGEPVSLWLPPPTAGGGGFLGGADRYLTREEHWMTQTLDHFNPTVSTANRRVLSKFMLT